MTTRNQKIVGGFTLVEALVASALVAMIAIVVAGLFRDVFSLRESLDASLTVANDARRLMRPFSDEVRSAGAGADGSFALAQTATSSFTFFADYDNDGVREKIRYFVSGKELRRGVTEPTGAPLSYTGQPESISILAGDVVASSTAFLYYSEGYDGSTTTAALGFPVSPSTVRAVRIWAAIDRDTNKLPPPMVVTTFAVIRNLRADDQIQ